MNRVTTESGAVYEFSDDYTKLRRSNPDAPLRKDGEWLECYTERPITGRPMSITIRGIIDPPGFTVRTTTPVVSVEVSE